MPLRQNRYHARVAFLAGAALAALTAGAAASDRPATAEGAKKISAFFETFAGKAARPPALVVTPEGSDYLVAIDIGALTSALKTTGVEYDAAVLKFKAFEQDDGTWRLEQSEFTPLSGHSRQGDATADFHIAATGYTSAIVIDPVLSWLRSGHVAADKINLDLHGPGLRESVDVGPLEASLTSKASPDGALSTAIKESLGAFSLKMTVDRKGTKPDAKPEAKPIEIAARADETAVALSLEGLKPRPLVDLWAYLVAHPTRPELAAGEAQLKSLLAAALASRVSIAEDIGMRKLTVETPQGPFGFEVAKIGVGGAMAGRDSAFNERFAASGLALPPGLVPDAFHDLVPTSFDIGFKVSGFDLTAAGSEAVADMHLAGDGPPISNADNDKVLAKLIGGGPLVVDITPSRIAAPQLDIAFDGQIRYAVGKPTGTITVHMHNFEKTVTALNGLGPEAETQMAPVIAMAKGLAKTDGDGGLTWIGEVGADRMMKVNGLPIGKAPF